MTGTSASGRACPHLGLHDLPPIGLELLELPKLHADILNGELQEVPEASQVLEGGHRECVGILWEQRDRVPPSSIRGMLALLAMGPSQLPVLALCPALLHGGPWSLSESMRHPLPSTADPWHCSPAHTHHVLLAEAVELLHLLGHEELGTAHSTPDLLQDWGGKQTVTGSSEPSNTSCHFSPSHPSSHRGFPGVSCPHPNSLFLAGKMLQGGNTAGQ